MEKKARLFRFLLLIYSLFILILIVTNFIKITTSVTDENQWLNLPSKIYATQDLVGLSFDSTKSKGYIQKKDTIHAGDLFFYIHDKSIDSIGMLKDFIDNYPDDTYINIIMAKSKIRPLPASIYRFKIKSQLLKSHPYRILDKGLFVEYVTEGGASDRAGMKPGDIITKINGQIVVDAFEADKTLRNYTNVKEMDYEILRANQVLNFKVELAKFGIKFDFLFLVFCGLCYFVIGFFIGYRQPRLKAAKLISIAFISFSFVASSGFNNRFVFDFDFYSIFQFVMVTLCYSLGFTFLYISSYYYPIEIREITSKKGIFKYHYILAGICILASFINYFFYVNPRIANYGNLILILYIVCINVASFFINVKYRLILKHEFRRYNLNSKILGFILLFLVLIMVFFTHLISIPNIDIILTYFFFVLITLVPLSYLYTIAKYKLLDIEIRVNKNIQYAVISVVWKILLFSAGIGILTLLPSINIDLPNISITGSSIEILKTPLPIENQVFYMNLILMISCILIFIVFVIINKYVTQFLDNKFYRSKYDYKNATVVFSEIFRTKFSINELANGITNKLKEIVHLKKIAIVFFGKEKSGDLIIYGDLNSDSEFNDLCSIASNDFKESIKISQGLIRIEYLHFEMREKLRKCDLKYIIPISSKDKIIGAFLLGEKLSESSFDNEDTRFIKSIAGQSFVAIENAILYEGLAEQERIKHELDIARKIQLSSLPQNCPVSDMLDIFAVCIPALEVGGDFYDFWIDKDNSINISVGDVSGKGTSAALYMSKVQGIMRTLNQMNIKIEELFSKTNKMLYKSIEKNSFITACCAAFHQDKQTMKYVRAGHLPLYYYSHIDNCITKITPKGIALGISSDDFFNTNIESITLDYNAGDVFLFITDGVIEARNSNGVEFGEDKLISIIHSFVQFEASIIVDSIIQEIKTFTNGTNQFDDVTIVVVKAK